MNVIPCDLNFEDALLNFRVAVSKKQDDLAAVSEDFLDHCRNAKEQLPEDMPDARGKSLEIMVVDASHAANKVACRSHAGCITFANRAPLMWFSKHQNTVESSAFSSKFVAMKTCVEHLKALRCKLRMFRAPILLKQQKCG